MSEASGTSRKSLIHKLGSILEPLDFARIFPAPQPVEVELGSGDGSFLVQYASKHLERNFLGVERLLGRLRKIDRKGARAGLKNLLALRIECSYFMQYLLAPGSTSAIHVYFPDPWPKRKHRHHRLINEAFTECAYKALKPEGIVYLRTDDADYFSQMNCVFEAHAGFAKTSTPADLTEVLTDFERDFNARGIQTLSAAFRARER